MLTEETAVDYIGITEHGHIEVRRATKVLRDGQEIARTFHRQVLAPGESLDEQPQRVTAVATAIWTPDVVETYRIAAASLPTTS